MKDSTPNQRQNHFLAGTGERVSVVDANGNETAPYTTFVAKLSDATTIALLQDDANWTGTTYTGTAITGTYEGMYYADNIYEYLCYSDNVWLRKKLYNNITYFSNSTGDAVGDVRQYINDDGWFVTEFCTVADASKGDGTWQIVEMIIHKQLNDNNMAATPAAGTYIDINIGTSGVQGVVEVHVQGSHDFAILNMGTSILHSQNANTVQTDDNIWIDYSLTGHLRIVNESGSSLFYMVKVTGVKGVLNL